MQDHRYPYTYSADYIRNLLNNSYYINRSTASHIRSKISVDLGLDDAMVARTIADSYLANHKSCIYDEQIIKKAAELY